MAALTEGDRVAVWARFMSENKAPVGDMTKADLHAAVAALDDFCEENQGMLLAGVPSPASTALSPSQQISLFMMVLQARVAS